MGRTSDSYLGAGTPVQLWVAMLLASTLSLLASRYADAGLNAWTSGGPEGGLARVMAIDPRTRDVVYAATSSAGVFKSTTGGNFWTPIDNGLSLQVHSFAIDSKTPTTLYAGSFIGGLFKSTNGGVSWFASNNGLPFPNDADAVFAIAVHPNSSTTLYVGLAGGGIFRSTDGGGTWLQVFTRAVPVFTLTIDPVTPTNVYAATLGAGVFKSTDGGGTWAESNFGLSDVFVPTVAIDPQTPTTLYATTFSGGVFKSVNGGASWTGASFGLPAAALATVSVVVDPDAPLILYLGTFKAGAFKSTDGGAHWFAINDGLPAGSLVTSLAVDRKTQGTLYAGLIGGAVFKSTNHGASWVSRNAGLVASSILALASPSQTPATLFAGTYREKLAKSTNGGASWTASSNGITDATVNAIAVDPQSPTTVYAATSERSIFVSATFLFGAIGEQVLAPVGPGGVFKSTDGGANWSQRLATSRNAQALAVENSLTLYAGTLGTGIFKSIDAGTQWFPVNTGLSFLSVFSLVVDPGSPGVVYAGTGDGHVFKTTNGGGTWTATGLSANAPVVALTIPPGTSTVYAGTWGDGAFKTTNGGGIWTAINSGLPIHSGSFGQPDTVTVFALAVDPRTPTTIYAGTFDRGVFKTTNGGLSWAPSNVGFSGLPGVHGLAINPGGTCLHAGTGRSVYDFATQVSPECPSPPTLQAAIRQEDRRQVVLPGTTAVARATISNVGATPSALDAVSADAGVTAQTCGVTQLTGAPTSFTYQVLGGDGIPAADPNLPVDIPAGGSFYFELRLLTDPVSFCPMDLQFGYRCTNTQSASTLAGVNTLQLGTNATNCGLSAFVSANQPTFVPGETLRLGGSINNGLPMSPVDFYVGILQPDKISIKFFTSDGGIATRNATDLASFPRLAANVSVPVPFSLNTAEFFVRPWQGDDPRGQYMFFVAAVKAGALADGILESGDILALATAIYSFP